MRLETPRQLTLRKEVLDQIMNTVAVKKTKWTEEVRGGACGRW